MIAERKKPFRTAQETLEAWKTLDMLYSSSISDRRFRAMLSSVEANEDYTEDAEQQDQLAQLTRITSLDWANYRNGLVNKRRITQLENMIRFRSKPRGKIDRIVLNMLIKYGTVYKNAALIDAGYKFNK